MADGRRPPMNPMQQRMGGLHDSNHPMGLKIELQLQSDTRKTRRNAESLDVDRVINPYQPWDPLRPPQKMHPASDEPSTNQQLAASEWDEDLGIKRDTEPAILLPGLLAPHVLHQMDSQDPRNKKSNPGFLRPNKFMPSANLNVQYFLRLKALQEIRERAAILFLNKLPDWSICFLAVYAERFDCDWKDFVVKRLVEGYRDVMSWTSRQHFKSLEGIASVVLPQMIGFKVNPKAWENWLAGYRRIYDITLKTPAGKRARVGPMRTTLLTLADCDFRAQKAEDEPQFKHEFDWYEEREPPYWVVWIVRVLNAQREEENRRRKEEWEDMMYTGIDYDDFSSSDESEDDPDSDDEDFDMLGDEVHRDGTNTNETTPDQNADEPQRKRKNEDRPPRGIRQCKRQKLDLSAEQRTSPTHSPMIERRRSPVRTQASARTRKRSRLADDEVLYYCEPEVIEMFYTLDRYTFEKRRRMYMKSDIAELTPIDAESISGVTV